MIEAEHRNWAEALLLSSDFTGLSQMLKYTFLRSLRPSLGVLYFSVCKRVFLWRLESAGQSWRPPPCQPGPGAGCSQLCLRCTAARRRRPDLVTDRAAASAGGVRAVRQQHCWAAGYAQQQSSSRVCAQCFSLENSFPHFLLLQVEPGRQKNAATVQFCAILTPCAQLAHCTLPSWWKCPLFMQNSRFWEISSQLYLRPLDIYIAILEYSLKLHKRTNYKKQILVRKVWGRCWIWKLLLSKVWKSGDACR